MRYVRERRNVRPLATIALIFLASGSPVSVAAAPGSGASDPPNVIFDTDVCLDDDDGMALAIVHALQARHEANLVAVTVGLDEKWCAPYVDILNTFYGRPDIPIGTIRQGPSLTAAVEKIHRGVGLPEVKQEQLSDRFPQFILKRRNAAGLPIYPHRLTNAAQAPEAVYLLRKTLAALADGSVVMIQVGNSANFAALLDSRPDATSNLSGPDLIKKKARFLSVMGGSFQNIKLPAGGTLLKGFGINFFEDVPSAQKVFDRWPTPIVISGAEIGEIKIPKISVEHDFSYVENHPIAEAYRYYCSWLIQSGYMPEIQKCPHDHHTADPTATLYALRPDRNYFSLSKPGKITVLPNGSVNFDAGPSGKHFYLTVSEEQKVRAQEAMMMLISQPPIIKQH